MSHYSPHIAVINDDTAFLALMEELLQNQEGYRISTCHEGDAGYGFVKVNQPDLVILDLVFNHAETGWRTLELLTLDPDTRQIPIILCTAAETHIQEHGAWLQRFDIETLPKPFDLEVLLEAVQRVLSRAGSGDGGKCTEK